MAHLFLGYEVGAKAPPLCDWLLHHARSGRVLFLTATPLAHAPPDVFHHALFKPALVDDEKLAQLEQGRGLLLGLLKM